jgi:hypothetical protein
MAENGALHLKLDLTLGALEIGTLISSVLFGFTTVQLYMYFKNDFRDLLWIRLLVSFVHLHMQRPRLIFLSKGNLRMVIWFS